MLLPHKMSGFLGVLFMLTIAALVTAQSPAPSRRADGKQSSSNKFMRIQRDAKGQATALQTAVVRFVPAAGDAGLIVDLVSAVHVADHSYYEKLNRQFEQYDAVLYELVAPEGTRIPKGGRKNSDNPIALLQQLATMVLDLESQTDQIDYTCRNFVHADLSPEQMAEAIRNRGDDGVTLFLGIAADLLRQQNRQELQKSKNLGGADADLDILSLMFDSDGSGKLKRALAEQMQTLESPDGGIGPTLSTILIADRNQAAIKVFQKELTKGKKRIAVFFGAAHMPDFQRRLLEDFGLKRQSEEWLTAWDMQARKRGLSDLLKLFDQ